MKGRVRKRGLGQSLLCFFFCQSFSFSVCLLFLYVLEAIMGSIQFNLNALFNCQFVIINTKAQI